MPRKAPTICNASGCGKPSHGRYCDDHQHLATGWQRSQRQGKAMGGRPWRRLRRQVLERDSYICQCADCRQALRIRPATEVDHIIPVSQGGTDDPNNLQAINSDCHKAKTQRESVGGRVK